MNDELDSGRFNLPIFEYNEEAMLNGVNADNVTFRLVDTSDMSEAALVEIYNAFWSAIANRTNLGVRRHHFFGYDIHAIIGALQYIYLVNYYDTLSPNTGAELDDACHNYFSIPPDKLPGDIHGIPSGQSRAPATQQTPEMYEGWHAVTEYGQTPALDQYNRLVAQLRQNGPRPSTLAGKSLDELLNELAEVEKSRRVLSLAAHVPAAIESSFGCRDRVQSSANGNQIGRCRRHSNQRPRLWAFPLGRCIGGRDYAQGRLRP